MAYGSTKRNARHYLREWTCWDTSLPNMDWRLTQQKLNKSINSLNQSTESNCRSLWELLTILGSLLPTLQQWQHPYQSYKDQQKNLHGTTPTLRHLIKLKLYSTADKSLYQSKMT